MNDRAEWQELIDRHLRGELDESEKERLAEMLDTDTDARRDFVEQVQWDTRLAEALRGLCNADVDADVPPATRSKKVVERPAKTTLLRFLLAAATVVIVALAAGLYLQLATTNRKLAGMNDGHVADPTIARITGLSGSLIWTGDRGQIVRDIRVDTELVGGTIEGMAPDSWFELEFNDGSTVMISGNSMLTFADAGQKELRLKEGRFSANVVPQPTGKPMLLHTHSALLKVLGTQFDVEAGMTATVLNVSEGRVQMLRLSDGSRVEVPAKHRVIAEEGRAMTVQRVRESVHHWKSQLHLGPTDNYGNYGKWLPATDQRAAAMRAIPFVPQESKAATLYLMGMPVADADSSPVVIQPGSRFVVRGRLNRAASVYFGIAVSYPNGEFAGKFRGDLAELQPQAELNDDHQFEAVYPLSDFVLDPCVRDRESELPARPTDLILTGVWAFTYAGGPSGLEVTEVELLPPTKQP